MSFLTVLPELKRRSAAESSRNATSKARAAREKLTRHVVQIESEAKEAIAFA